MTSSRTLSQPKAPSLSDLAKAATASKTEQQDAASTQDGKSVTGASASGEAGEGQGAKSGSAGTARHVVDTRTTDAGDVRITVIAYSDGTTETLTSVKGGPKGVEGGLKGLPKGADPAAGFGDRGMFVDRSA